MLYIVFILFIGLKLGFTIEHCVSFGLFLSSIHDFFYLSLLLAFPINPEVDIFIRKLLTLHNLPTKQSGEIRYLLQPIHSDSQSCQYTAECRQRNRKTIDALG
jgi:hypothetical protein